MLPARPFTSSYTKWSEGCCNPPARPLKGHASGTKGPVQADFRPASRWIRGLGGGEQHISLHCVPDMGWGYPICSRSSPCFPIRYWRVLYEIPSSFAAGASAPASAAAPAGSDASPGRAAGRRPRAGRTRPAPHRPARGAAQRRRQVLDRQRIAAAEHDHALDAVFQLAHVAGPGVAPQPLHHLRRDADRSPAEPPRRALQEMVDQDR